MPYAEPRKPRTVIFHSKLRQFREARGLTKRQLAKVLDHKCDSVVASMENGWGLNLRTAMLVAAYFGVSVEEIWTPVEGRV